MSATPIPCLLQSYKEVATRLERFFTDQITASFPNVPPHICGRANRTRVHRSSTIPLSKSATVGLDGADPESIPLWSLWIPARSFHSHPRNDGMQVFCSGAI